MPFSITAIWGNHRKERVKPEPFYGKCPVVMLKNVFYASRTLCQMAIMPNNFKQNSWAQMPQHGCPSVGWHMSKRHKESILLGGIMAIRHNVIKKNDWLCLHVVMPNGIMPNTTDEGEPESFGINHNSQRETYVIWHTGHLA